ncbi:M23 family metallopeptidase [Benzoatithermus flavus]|uniref:M23 family metallopeptidase n=1 Tax=Benzoatithermus flavus TaxID=3108223 RepID=A0ABU8XSH8_9PROT
MTPRIATVLLGLSALLPFLSTAAPVRGEQALALGLPLACTPGEDCWVVRLSDRDPGPGFTDYRCGGLGSDGHDGTDFALPDPARMRAGVPVLAAAAGTVRAARDGMPDQPPTGQLAHDFGRLSCGNGVLLQHEGGWETQYCHLRQGSVRVRPGQAVAAGDALGLVGMSGEANFPHVHLGVRREGQTIDPFTGTPTTSPCGKAGTPLWEPELRAALDYVAVPIAIVGLAGYVPSHRDIVSGAAASVGPRPDTPLVGYVLAYGLKRGDRIGITVTGPDGTVVSRASFPVEEEAPRASRSAGRKAPPGGWPAGTYRVEASVERGDARWSKSRELTLTQ